MSIKVLYISHLLEETGWGQASRDILAAMDLAGIDVVPRIVEAGSSGYKPKNKIQQLLSKSDKDCDIVIQHVLPHLYEYHGNFKKNIGMFYSETSKLQYTSYFSYLRMMDELWVPSKMMATQVATSYIDTPIKIIPHPFNTYVNPEKYQRLEIPECNEGDYIFYYIGEATRRKNLSALIRAFHTEFSFNEPVQLVIKANKFGMSAEECAKLVNEFAGAAKQHIKMYYDLNRYKQEIIITSRMTNNDIRRLHQTCDCLVMPSSGEAINLPAMDAILFGNKVIGNVGTGMCEFIKHEDNGYLVQCNRKQCYGMVEGFQDMYTSREICYEIDEIDLMRAMRWAYNNRQPNQAKITPSLLDVGNIIKETLNAW